MHSAISLRALSLVAGAAALGLVTNAVRPGGVALASFAPPTECTGPHDGKAAGVPEDLAPADAAGLCGQPGVVVADARTAGAYAEGHVAGAVHLPCDAGDAAGAALTHFDRAQRIVVYGATSEDARPVADGLRRRHPHARVQVLAGGFAAWSSAGLACASGPCDECKTAATTTTQSGPQTATATTAASSGATVASSGNTAAPSSSTAASSGTTAASSGTTAASSGTTAASSGATAASSGTTAASSGNTAGSSGNTAASSGTTAASSSQKPASAN